MIDRDLVEMLDSSDPEDRIFAVKAMAKSKNPEYLQYLASVYKTDYDPQVKELALKAGKYIKKMAAEEEWTGGDEEYDEDAEDEIEEVEVSGMDVQRAQGFVEQAMNLNLHNQNEKAAEALAKAFRVNPNLRHDGYAVGLAASVTGLGDEAAFEYLTSDEFGGNKKKKRSGSAPNDETTWEEALIDLAVYWVVNAGVAVVSTLLFSRALTDLATSSGLSPSDFTDINPLIGADIFLVLIAGFAGSLFQVLGLLIYYAAIHFAATTLFAGDGTFRGLIHKTANYLIVVVVVFSITGFIQQYNSVAFFLTEDGGNTTLAGISAAISFFGGIASMFWFGSLIGKNYDFGMGKGCASVIVGIIGLIVLTCGCIVVISSVFGAGLSALGGMSSGAF